MSIYNTAYNYVLNMYPSETWKIRVSRMKEAQIMAIYFRDIRKDKNNDTYHQMTLDEWSEERRNHES